VNEGAGVGSAAPKISTSSENRYRLIFMNMNFPAEVSLKFTQTHATEREGH